MQKKLRGDSQEWEKKMFFIYISYKNSCDTYKVTQKIIVKKKKSITIRNKQIRFMCAHEVKDFALSVNSFAWGKTIHHIWQCD